jgi:hypothetical protein
MPSICPRILALAAGIAAVAGCAAHRPVLYPNDHLNRVGSERAGYDIEDCKRIASGIATSGQGGKIAAHAVTGSAVGAAAGAAGGAVWGHAGRGAASGAAAGAAAGLLGGLFRSAEPSPVYKGAVDACLAERGYRVIGWE